MDDDTSSWVADITAELFLNADDWVGDPACIMYLPWRVYINSGRGSDCARAGPTANGHSCTAHLCSIFALFIVLLTNMKKVSVVSPAWNILYVRSNAETLSFD